MSQQLNICSETALTLKYFSKLLPNALILPMECTSIWKSALKLLWDWNTLRSCCEMPWYCQQNVPAFENLLWNCSEIEILPEVVAKCPEIANGMYQHSATYSEIAPRFKYGPKLFWNGPRSLRCCQKNSPIFGRKKMFWNWSKISILPEAVPEMFFFSFFSFYNSLETSVGFESSLFHLRERRKFPRKTEIVIVFFFIIIFLIIIIILFVKWTIN